MIVYSEYQTTGATLSGKPMTFFSPHWGKGVRRFYKKTSQIKKSSSELMEELFNFIFFVYCKKNNN
jgi:hypothetical protein